MNTKGSLIISAGIVVGLTICGIAVGNGFQKFRTQDRIVSVKGFSEKEVKADIAFWTLQLKTANNNLTEGNNSIDSAKDKVIRFLTQNGVKPEEIIQKDVQVDDRQTNNYNDNNRNAMRYIISKSIEVRSNDVDNLLRISRMTDELIKAGVAMSTTNDWQNQGLVFSFTKLNDVKPTMLADANTNARLAALKFAKENDSKLGKLRRATQGLFTITDRDQALTSQNEGGGSYRVNGADLYKKIRVVVSVDYSIE